MSGEPVLLRCPFTFSCYLLFKSNPIYPQRPKTIQNIYDNSNGREVLANSMLLGFRNGGQSLFYLLSSCFCVFVFRAEFGGGLAEASREVKKLNE